MYTKPTFSALRLDVEHNSCDCAGSGPAVLAKLNPANSTCGRAFMTPQSYSTS